MSQPKKADPTLTPPNHSRCRTRTCRWSIPVTGGPAVRASRRGWTEWGCGRTAAGGVLVGTPVRRSGCRVPVGVCAARLPTDRFLDPAGGCDRRAHGLLQNVRCAGRCRRRRPTSNAVEPSIASVPGRRGCRTSARRLDRITWPGKSTQRSMGGAAPAVDPVSGRAISVHAVAAATAPVTPATGPGHTLRVNDDASRDRDDPHRAAPAPAPGKAADGNESCSRCSGRDRALPDRRR